MSKPVSNGSEKTKGLGYKYLLMKDDEQCGYQTALRQSSSLQMTLPTQHQPGTDIKYKKS